MFEKGPPEYLFIYGTLRRGAQLPIEVYLGKAVAFVGMGVYQGILFDLGNYPGVTPSSDEEHQVKGEIYRIEKPEKVFAQLDYYEGFNPSQPEQSEYTRQKEFVIMDKGTIVNAWIYLYNGPIDGLPVIESGDYLQYLEEQTSKRK